MINLIIEAGRYVQIAEQRFTFFTETPERMRPEPAGTPA